MKIYYIEYEETVKFFNGEHTVEFNKDNLLKAFLKYCYKKYGKELKFECLV